jgi:hypothetical protein
MKIKTFPYHIYPFFNKYVHKNNNNINKYLSKGTDSITRKQQKCFGFKLELKESLKSACWKM